MKKHIVEPGQSLFDVAVIRYGNVSGITWLLEDNKELKGPTDRIYPGQVLSIRVAVISIRQKVYLEDFPTIATISAQDMPEGIGFWMLEEYTVGGEVIELGFVDGSLGFEADGEGYTIHFALTVTGAYTAIFTDDNDVFVNEYQFNFEADVVTAFGLFAAGTYNIQIGTISTQITIP